MVGNNNIDVNNKKICLMALEGLQFLLLLC